MQKITPFFWFDNQAEETVNFYISIVKNSKILSVAYYEGANAKHSSRPAGSVMMMKLVLK